MLDFKLLLLMSCTCLVYIKMVCGRPINEVTETGTGVTPDIHLPADFSDSNSDSSKPNEVQKAVCTVTSGNVRASAEAFTTRELKGVCGSADMLKSFFDLEKKLGEELENIKNILKDLQRKVALQRSAKQSINETSQETVTSADGNYVATQVQLKSLPSKDEATIASSVRDKGVSKYNNTIVTNKDVKAYMYYWRIDNFTQSIKSRKSFSMESPLFSIGGKVLKIKAHFQHLHRDYLYLQLEDYSSVPKLKLGNSIILDTGGIFKEINSDRFKYKILIIDQINNRSSDLISQEFDNYETGFSIPNSALIDSPFVEDDSLLIQLFLYL